MYMHCYRSGEIVLSRAPDMEGAIALCQRSKPELLRLLSVKARLAYDDETWLVPSLPEAVSDTEAMIALETSKPALSKINPEQLVHWGELCEDSGHER